MSHISRCLLACFPYFWGRMDGRGAHMDARETALKQRIAEGDEQAFAVLFHQYCPLLRGFIQSFTHSGPDAEERLQETFIRIWLNRDKLPSIENLRAWIFTIASRQCLKAIRTQLREKAKLDGYAALPPGLEPTPFDRLQVREISRLVNNAIANMPPQRRKIYLMSRTRGLKPAAIAAELRLSVSTVKNTLSASLKDIRRELRAAGHLVSLILTLIFSAIPANPHLHI